MKNSTTIQLDRSIVKSFKQMRNDRKRNTLPYFYFIKGMI